MTAFLSHLSIPLENDIAIGLSGGPDSMSLVHMLNAHIEDYNFPIKLHALTVNHNLREDARDEAERVGQWIKDYKHTSHHILDWTDEKSQTRIMEAARNARYSLIEDYCKQHKIKTLFVAHHQDDQVETFLFRLSKGSGLDGLAAMRETYTYSEHLNIIRPLMNHTKESLIDYCHQNDIPYINDPSNEKTQYARPRLRESRLILEKEGLTSQRLSKTVKRLDRARHALEWMSEKALIQTCAIYQNNIKINLSQLGEYPEEIHMRVLQSAIMFFNKNRDYAPRLEKIEKIAEDMLLQDAFRKRTFAKIIFERTLEDGDFLLILTKE